MSGSLLASSGSSKAQRPAMAWSGERVLVLAIVAAAFGLRVARLGTQSLWGDEMFSVYRARQTLAEITAAVPHERTIPPLYYYLLHAWIRLAGTTETAVRFPSVVFGVLAVALLYALVRRTLGARMATIAALLATLSPFWIYYAQETRAYAQATALLVLALYLLVRAAGQPDPGPSLAWWAGYVVASALALSSFYFDGFALAAGVAWVLVQRRNWPDVARRCLLAQCAVVLLLAPLLIAVGPGMIILAGEVNHGGPSLATIVQHLELAFNVGTTIELARVAPEVTLAFVLAGLGLIGTSPRAALLWGLLLVGPVLAIWYVSFVPQAGWERYFLPATPAWYALVAAGLNAVGLALGSRIARRDVRAGLLPTHLASGLRTARWGVAVLAGGALVYGMGQSLGNYYFDPGYWRHDFRAAVHRVDGVVTADVAAIVNGPPQYPSFFYYYRGTIPAAELPRPSEDASQTRAHLAVLAARYRGLWFVKYNPPEYDFGGVIESWLSEHYYPAGSTWVENTTFSLYLTEDPAGPRVAAADGGPRTFGDDAQLASYRATTTRTQNDDYLLVTLTWRALRTPPQPLTVFAHLVDRDGHLIAQSDHAPVANLRPSHTWRAGDVLDDHFALELPNGSARSGLHLAVGLYRPDGTRLPIQAPDATDNSLTIALTGLE